MGFNTNGVPWPQQPAGTYSYLESLRFETMDQFGEAVPAGNELCNRFAGANHVKQPLLGFVRHTRSAAQLRLRVENMDYEWSAR